MPTANQDVSAALHWWRLENGGLSCTICSEEQNVEWLIKFTKLLENANYVQNRLELFRIYDMVDGFLMNFHSLKMEMGNDLMKMFIKSYNGNYKNQKLIYIYNWFVF